MAKKSTHFIVQAGLIAALYATLTLLQNTLLPNSTSAAVQFRVAEILTLLALYTPAAIPGLTLGCIIANISSLSVLGPWDMIFGSLASLLAAVLIYLLKNVRFYSLPILASLTPALTNGLIIGLEIDILDGGFELLSFLTFGGCVALGELGVLLILGLPFTRIIEKTKLDKNILSLK